MIHELYPDLYHDGGRLSTDKRRDCQNADHIIAISHSTKNDLIEQFSIPPQKISVVHLASTELVANSTLKGILGKGKPYLLFVGQRGGYKNFEALLIAYSSSSRLKRAFDLVCFGGGPASPAEQARVDELGLGGQVKFVAGADEDLRAYYETARMLVYPSLYEGFGLPVLEAMQSGCAVMCSATSSLPEVAGSAAVYISGDFAGQLERIAFDDSELDRFRHAGSLQAAQFSWDRCATETTSIYRSLLKC